MNFSAKQPAHLLLIDGNNLAHFLYTNLVPGQKMTNHESQRLIEHLSSYARTYGRQVEIELCMDRGPGPLERLPGNLRVLAAEFPQTADDLLIDRFWFHYTTNQPCLVISNDQAILDEVAQATPPGSPVPTLRVSDFVRRPGWNTPVLREPDDLPPARLPEITKNMLAHPLPLSASVYVRIIEEERSLPAPQSKNTVVPKKPPSAKKNGRIAEEDEFQADKQESYPGILPEQPTQEPAALNSTAAADDNPARAESANEPLYFLNLPDWPLVEGVHFLRNAFCDTHRPAVEELLQAADPATLTPADLRGLAELLLHTCADEPDFARRGALMVRARLALLQARGDPLTLRQLAERTGLKQAGLRGRLKAKAGQWILILLPELEG